MPFLVELNFFSKYCIGVDANYLSLVVHDILG